MFCQCVAEVVLLMDAGIAPTAWPIELGNDRAAVIQTNSVNPIFVAVQCADTPICRPANSIYGVQNLMRIERLEGNGSFMLVYDNYSIRSINVAICL